MNIVNFLKDKGIFLAVNLITFIIVIVAMIFFNMGIAIVFIIGCIWFIPLLSYMLVDYIKWKRYLSNLEEILDKLDKKYLLPEVIEETDFLIGEKINDIFRTLSRDMHENIKYYRNMQEEYREYIEIWVHEIKTPIASSKLIIENNNNEVTRKIDSQIYRIENFVEQVLYYSKSSDVNMDYIIKKINLDQVVRKVIKKNYRDFISKKIKLELGEVQEIIYSDTKWIEFIINQIIGNSIKYTNASKGIIRINSKRIANSVMLIIEDNGVGIIERDLNRVFEKGFTGENGRRFGESTGIGLYLCKKLSDKLGLGLKLESELCKGTRVTITFPIDYNMIYR